MPQAGGPLPGLWGAEHPGAGLVPRPQGRASGIQSWKQQPLTLQTTDLQTLGWGGHTRLWQDTHPPRFPLGVCVWGGGKVETALAGGTAALGKLRHGDCGEVGVGGGVAHRRPFPGLHPDLCPASTTGSPSVLVRTCLSQVCWVGADGPGLAGLQTLPGGHGAARGSHCHFTKSPSASGWDMAGTEGGVVM